MLSNLVRWWWLGAIAVLVLIASVWISMEFSKPLLSSTDEQRLANTALFIDDLNADYITDFPHGSIRLQADGTIEIHEYSALRKEIPAEWSVQSGVLYLGDYPLHPQDDRLELVEGGPGRGWIVGRLSDYPEYWDPPKGWWATTKEWVGWK